MVCAVLRSAIRPGADLALPEWQTAPVPLSRSWRGEAGPAALGTTARLLWTADALWIGFECAYVELDVDSDPDPAVKRHGLWERDVCEAFVQSPRERGSLSYKEFEVAPTGQWFDVAIHRPRVAVDWDWNSGMRTYAAIDPHRRLWRAVMTVPFTAFGGPPRDGEPWRLNLFRIGRLDGHRHYLALSPTGTSAPDFHVPERFVPLHFTRE